NRSSWSTSSKDTSFNTENVSLPAYLQVHATAYSDGNQRFDKELERFNLKDFYWHEIAAKYNYHNEQPAIYDFLLEVFGNNFSQGRMTGIDKESRILLFLWKDAISYRESFRKLSDTIARDLDIETALNEVSFEEVLQDDLFQLVDKRIISELTKLVEDEIISNDRLDQIIKQRENKYWYLDFESFYACLKHGADLISLVRKNEKINIRSFEEGVKIYSEELFRIDHHYRKFIFHYRKTTQNKVLEPLAEKIDKVYSNDWLLAFNDKWQQVLDKAGAWPFDSRYSLRKFFDIHAKPLILKKQRLFVIISDAFRYECGREFLQRIQGEKRYEGELGYMFTDLPSYTQLGMASLLPAGEISITPGSDSVLINGRSTQGVQGRTNILQELSGVRAVAINAEDFMKMNSATDGREFVKQHDLIYIYHNRIDKVGDDKTTEDKVFDAVNEELAFLMDIVKKIANMNGTHMFITSDHGFIYQHKELDESDFAAASYKGEAWKESRRFVIGKGLKGDDSTKHFTSAQLGLTGDAEFLIPKSINRLRVKGAGSRFVHGGTSLQEIMVPLIKVIRKRSDTTKLVDVDIIKSTDKITTNILAVSFLQFELVTDKILPRKLRTAIYAQDGALLSDQFMYFFDSAQGSVRQREVKHRFQLGSLANSKYKNQRVKLVLEEPVEGSSKWKQYKEYLYTLNISFTSDFDNL
nr:BREX-1 system phosphatase PglZ type A [Bacteroidota bacterium]